MDRHKLRADLRTRRDLFLGADRRFVVSQALLELLKGASCVGSYVKVGSEVDPVAVVNAVPCLALPRIAHRGATMTFQRWNVEMPLENAPFNFLQPPDNGLPVAPDLILAPLIGFDRAGNRLGQGGGHYDRYFSSNPEVLRVGLAWSMQEVRTLPVADWDMSLDAIATEREWIVPLSSRLTQ